MLILLLTERTVKMHRIKLKLKSFYKILRCGALTGVICFVLISCAFTVIVDISQRKNLSKKNFKQLHELNELDKSFLYLNKTAKENLTLKEAFKAFNVEVTDKARLQLNATKRIKTEVLLPQAKGFTRKTKISFLKIPKTGSSTMATLFIRFGIRYNLTMFIPNRFSVSDTLQRKLITQKRHFDIFTMHTHYSHDFFTNIVKNPEIIGLVRDPYQRWISHAFHFHRKDKAFDGLSDEEFLNEMLKNNSKVNIHNMMANYFRIPKSAEQNKTELKLLLEKINAEFTLVLVLEKLHESLVLMKRLLNWSYIDILYEKQKPNVYYRDKIILNKLQREQFEIQNQLDLAIYNFFLDELNKKIINAGEDLLREVEYFKDVRRKVNQCCKTILKSGRCSFSPSKWDSGFDFIKTECIILSYDVGALKSPRYTIL